MPSHVTYEFGPFRFASAGLLYRKGKQVHLTPKEAGVLLTLLERAGDVVEKKEFREKVWPDVHKEIDIDDYLKRAIFNLRKALGENRRGTRYVLTLSKRGYRFVARVKVISGAGGASPKKLMLLVLPFRSLGRRKQPDSFIDGLTYETITQLGRLNPEQLGLIAPMTALGYKNTNKKIRTIGKELGVSHVLGGVILQSGSQVRISVHLIQVRNESQLWAETYERKLDDILVFMREACQDIARRIEVKLVPHEQARLDYLRPVQPEAYKTYLNGRYLWNKRTPKSLQEAAILFLKAIALDPGFALAHSALADCYAVIASQSWAPPKQACNEAKMAAVNAMNVDATFAEPHAALGFVLSVFERQWTQAEQEFQEALCLNSNCATAHHWYSFYFAAIGRLPEALHQVRKAQEIDPLSRMINTNVGTMLYWAREYDAAIEQYDNVLKLDADFWYAHWMRGMAHEAKKRHQEAVADQQRAIRYFPGRSPLLQASLSRSLALSGNQKDARRALKNVHRSPRHSSLPHYHLALAYAALGDEDAAFRSLLDSSAAQEMWISFIQVDPKMDALRRDARYGGLRRALSL